MTRLELRNHINQKINYVSEYEKDGQQTFKKTVHPQIFLDMRDEYDPMKVKRVVKKILNLDNNTDKFIEIAKNITPEFISDSKSV